MLIIIPLAEQGSTSCEAMYHRGSPSAVELGATRSRMWTIVSQQEDII